MAEPITKFESEIGMTINKDCEELKAAMKEQMVPATSKGIVAVCGQEIYDEVQGYVEAARAA